ncbi:flagellar motor protein MotB [Pusillimonas sp. ANT_WB101]|uniref:flagellar motor protein MotB n=1 Tax=Pusillimonas sp. ANT_WB101 TaxID=2597356 RepID=UPI0011EE6858|nr:flagellar motor protein MotB [Pusillimonas sp. ANT_WB101]KAA0910738.1 flagellar motor protein MotB [Pusillimonas sp. ANT_WB101]
MSQDSTSTRIVIRRKRGHEEDAPHGSWKIAYADFMTAMMAFFLVMWLLSLVPPKDLHAIAEYFRTPLITAITGGPKYDHGSTVIPGGAPTVIPQSLIPSESDAEAEQDRHDTLRLDGLRQEIEQLIETDPVLREFRPQLLLDMTPDGLRVQIIDQQNRPMFATGSAQVQTYLRDVLRHLGPVFNRIPNSISIAGHTDSTQYASGERLYSNWELSADRANAARQELVAGGMSEPKIKRILGLASSVSLVKDNPGAAVNRRISIVVLNRRAEQRIDKQNAAGAPVTHLDALPEPQAAPSLPRFAATP